MRKALRQKVAYKPIPFKEGNGFLPNMSFRENGFCSESILRQLLRFHNYIELIEVHIRLA